MTETGILNWVNRVNFSPCFLSLILHRLPDQERRVSEDQLNLEGGFHLPHASENLNPHSRNCSTSLDPGTALEMITSPCDLSLVPNSHQARAEGLQEGARAKSRGSAGPYVTPDIWKPHEPGLLTT